MKPLSDATARIAAKNFERKFIALGRVVSQWSDIVGEDLASKAQPVKIQYYKQSAGDTKKTARLDIAATEADATVLRMQVGLILERINQLFGDGWIRYIRFVPVQPANMAPKPKKYNRQRRTPLKSSEKKYLQDSLEQIEDCDIKQTLASLGEAILKERD
jgi:hypothetical protein